MDRFRSGVSQSALGTLPQREENEDQRSGMTPLTGTFTETTESTGSNQTIRGTEMPMSPGIFVRTPSFPFPHMNVESGTPTGTPGVHMPFTALSPTGQPSVPARTKAAKGKVAREFMASDHMKAQSTHQVFPEGSPADGPNVFEIAVQVQSELGLVGWWSQTTQVLKESFNVDRATLAVPSDSAEIENVPWAQLATFNVDEEDSLSTTTTEPQSATSSLNEVLRQENALFDRKRDKVSFSNLRSLALKAGSNLAGRPKLESRHSYAGYPIKYQSVGPEAFSSIPPSANRPTPSRHGSQVLSSGNKSSVDRLRLSAEQLKRYDMDELSQGPLSEDTNLSSRGPSGQVLKTLQSLESENDPLITTTGVGRVLNNSSATILTRKYLDQRSGKAEEDQKKQTHAGKNSPFPSRLHQESRSGHVEREAKVSRPRQGRSNTGSTTKNASPLSKSETQRQEKLASTPPYEDYEQIPGTPWAQSPAPSPAALVDPEESPFFSTNTSVDNEAFSNHPPLHHYTSGQQIEAIGLDKSSSIIQIPLIHPTAALSQPQRFGRLRQDRRTKGRRTEGAAKGPPRQRFDSSERTRKRIPLAILSILAPKIPYPPHLVECLNQLSPLLATSFHAARQHSNLQSELAAVARGRDRSSVRLDLHDTPFSLSKAQGRAEKDLNISLSSNSIGSSVEADETNEHYERISTSDEVKDQKELPTYIKRHDEAKLPSERSKVLQASKLDSRGLIRAPQNEEAIEDGTPGSRPVRQGVSDQKLGGEERGNKAIIVDKEREQSDWGAGQRLAPSQPLHVLKHSRSERNDQVVNRTDALSVATQSPAQLKRHGSHQHRSLHSQGASVQATNPSSPRTASILSSNDRSRGSEASEFLKEPSLSMLKTMIDNGATQQFIVDPDDGNVVWANSKFQVYRSSAGESIHDQFWNNIYHKDRKSFKKEWTSALQTGEQLSHQIRLRRFDSQYRWFHVRFLPIKDKLSITQYWHGQAMDIHDLHEAEVKAAKSREKSVSEAKYRAIANSLPVIVFAASVPAGMTFANTQWLSYSGQVLDEALGFGFLDHVHPEDLVKCRFPGFDTSGGTPKAATNLHSPRQGITREDSVASSTADSEATSATDKTVRVRPKRPYSPLDDVPIPNELLRGLAQDGVILCAKDGQGNLSITTELRLKSREGEYRWHLVQGCYIESVNFGQGDAQWFIACTDISSQKHTEAKMEQTNIALEVSNAALGKEMQQKMGYLSSMSHEIRTPLNGIIGNLQFLINSGLDEAAAEWAHGAQEAAKGMHELINDILDLSKAEAKMLKLLSHWFNPRSLMEQVVDMLNSKASEKKLELCHECSDDVPKSIRGDSGRIRQVLLNLVGNAVKFTKTGEIVVKCDLLSQVPELAKYPELGQNEIFVRWAVTDTGSGFTEEDKKLLFKPYSQIKSKNTRDIGGTGLGLTLCKTMVELHGGEITASSSPGIGSTFTFFARFKSRKDSAHSQQMLTSGPPSPAITGEPVAPATEPGSLGILAGSPALVPSLPATIQQDSPALMSDGSLSAPSIRSLDNQHSLRSSVSTMDSELPMKLSLPSSTGTIQSAETSGPQSPISPLSAAPMPKRVPANPLTTRSTPLSPRTAPVSTDTTTNPVPTNTRTTSTSMKKSSALIKSSLIGKSMGQGRANFRPPMLSILVFCPLEKTRRITCDRIQAVAARSAPCNITLETAVDDTLRLFQGADPVHFTHVVLRSTSDHEISGLLKKIVPIAIHLSTCIVLITDQAQVNALKSSAPDLDFDELTKLDRIRLLLKPAHPHKLAKIFDPFNENALDVDVPKEVKRREQQEQQKKSWEMFGKVLGYKHKRVMAVEDNPVQMKVSVLSYQYRSIMWLMMRRCFATFLQGSASLR